MNPFMKILSLMNHRIGIISSKNCKKETIEVYSDSSKNLDILTLQERISELESNLEEIGKINRERTMRENKLLNLYNEESSELAGLKWEYYVLSKRLQTSQMNLAGYKGSEKLARIQLDKLIKENEDLKGELSVYAARKD
jgi:hypothetical protein